MVETGLDFGRLYFSVPRRRGGRSVVGNAYSIEREDVVSGEQERCDGARIHWLRMLEVGFRDGV